MSFMSYFVLSNLLSCILWVLYRIGCHRLAIGKSDLIVYSFCVVGKYV